jgi:hypothetical protein
MGSGNFSRPGTAASPAASLAVSLVICTVAACSSPSTLPELPTYQGGLEILLEPNDPQNVCSATFLLRNRSGVLQGAAYLELEWLDSKGSRLARQSLRMDPTHFAESDPRVIDGKNLPVDGVTCAQVARARIVSARWELGWDYSEEPQIGRIGGVDGTEWQFRWNEEQRLFVSQPAPE